MWSPPFVITYEYFDKYKSLASGLSMCGLSVASFIMIMLYRYSIDVFSWRGGMLIMAGVALNGCACGMLYVTNVPKKDDNKFCKSLQCTGLQNCNYVIFVFANCLHTCQITMVYLMSTSRAVSKGLSEMEGSLLISCIGLASTITRFITSWVSNMKCTSHIGLYTCCVFAMSGMIVLSCSLPANIISYASVSCLFGLMIGR